MSKTYKQIENAIASLDSTVTLLDHLAESTREESTAASEQGDDKLGDRLWALGDLIDDLVGTVQGAINGDASQISDLLKEAA